MAGRFKLVSEGNKQEHSIHGWLDIIRWICSIQCTLPVSMISRSHPGNTQAGRHQQVILYRARELFLRSAFQQILPSTPPKTVEIASGSFTFEYKQYVLF